MRTEHEATKHPDTGPQPVIELVSDRLAPEVNIFVYNLDLIPPDYDSPADDPLPLTTLNVVYAATVDNLDFQQRLSLIKGIVEQVRSAQLNPYCLLSVATVDHEPEIIDLALRGFLTANHPGGKNALGAIDAIAYMLEDNTIRNLGAVHASLACFGDRRLCTLLKALGVATPEMIDENFFEALSTPRTLRLATLDYLLETLVRLEYADEFSKDHFAAGIAAYLVSSLDHGNVYDSAFNFGPHCFPHEIISLKQPYSEFLSEIESLLMQFELSGIASLERLATVLRHPANSWTLEDLKILPRSDSDRRGGDRRVVNMVPLIDRRSRQRRLHERRHSGEAVV